MPSATVIVPTYNRPRELRECIRSVLAQTVRPQEVLVVDDGDLDELPLGQEVRRAGIAYRLIRKPTPGLTESRAAGVASSSGEIVFFLDDDVVLFPDYIERILEVYAADGPHRIGGVGGVIVNTKPLTFARSLRYAFNVAFLLSGFREGGVLPSGVATDFGTTPFLLRETSTVRFLSGGVSSFRREVFDTFGWSPRFDRFAVGEDKHFSIRVGHRYKLVVTPHARLYHYETPAMRPDKWARGRGRMAGQYLVFRECVQRHGYDWIFFYHSAIGYLLARVAVAIVSRDRTEWQRVGGILHALKAIVTDADPMEAGPANENRP